MIAPNFTVTSAFPVNVVEGSELNGDSVNNDRPLFRGRNNTPGYGFKEVNLRIRRAFRFHERFSLEIIGEAESATASRMRSVLTGYGRAARTTAPFSCCGGRGFGPRSFRKCR